MLNPLGTFKKFFIFTRNKKSNKRKRKEDIKKKLNTTPTEAESPETISEEIQTQMLLMMLQQIKLMMGNQPM